MIAISNDEVENDGQKIGYDQPMNTSTPTAVSKTGEGPSANRSELRALASRASARRFQCGRFCEVLYVPARLTPIASNALVAAEDRR